MMRVQCDVCEKAVAQVVCCADEAALCLACDKQVHAANKLASKHPRLRLLPSHPLPLCDICQEKPAFIFCLEDRALVCRNCDVAIHVSNTLAARHQRFLATGVRVALDNADEVDAALPKPSVQPPARGPCVQPPAGDNRDTPQNNQAACLFTAENPSLCMRAGEPDDQIQKSFDLVNEWQDGQGLKFSDLAPVYPLADIEFSKSNLAPLGDQDWMTDLGLLDGHVYTTSLAEVPQTSVMVSTRGSSHTAMIDPSVKGRPRQDVSMVPVLDDVSVVPDLIAFTAPVPALKRQKIVLGT